MKGCGRVLSLDQTGHVILRVCQLQPQLFFTKCHQNAAKARLYSSENGSVRFKRCQASVSGWSLSWSVHQREPLSLTSVPASHYMFGVYRQKNVARILLLLRCLFLVWLELRATLLEAASHAFLTVLLCLVHKLPGYAM